MSGRNELESVLRNPDVLRVRRGRFLREDSARYHPSRCLIGEERGRDVRESVVFREFSSVEGIEDISAPSSRGMLVD